MIRCHVANRQLEAQSSGSVLEMVQTDHLNARAIETCPPFEGPESSDSFLPALSGLQDYIAFAYYGLLTLSLTHPTTN